MDVSERLGQLALFADLTQAQIETIAHTFDEMVFKPGERVLRRGLSSANFFVILDGDAKVVAGEDLVRRLGRGDFFGEIGALTGDAPSADVIAESVLRCLVIPPRDLERLLLERPQMMLRLLRTEARRLQTLVEWQT